MLRLMEILTLLTPISNSIDTKAYKNVKQEALNTAKRITNQFIVLLFVIKNLLASCF